MIIYAFAGITILGSIALQIITFALNNNLELLNFLSLFTIQSNIVAGIVFILINYKNHQVIDYLRGLATHSLLITSIGYIFLLGSKQDYLLPLVNIVVHYLTPSFALLYWIIQPPTMTPTIKSASTWLLFPFLFFVYSMTRGFFTNWYPYDFIDPNKIPLYEIAITFISVLIGSLILSWMLTLITKRKFQPIS